MRHGIPDCIRAREYYPFTMFAERILVTFKVMKIFPDNIEMTEY